MIIKDYKQNPNQQSPAKAFFIVEYPAGLQIRNWTLYEKNGKRWLTAPSREYEKDGKKKYFPLVGYEDKEANDQFLGRVMEALKEFLNNGGQHE